LPRTVLLADDSVTAQNMGRRILTDAGYEVITVNNGSAALKKIHEIRPDLIVLDVYMPGYGGLEVCQRLKESGETMKIPVLLTVGKMEPFKADEAKRVRADAHIVKPFDASELLAALAKLEDRIVPAESSKGRKSKKPSFWHEDDSKTPRDWSDNAEYLAQVKERKNNSTTEDAAPEPAPEEPAPTPSSNVGAFPLVHEATGELPVVPDSVSSDEQSAPVALSPQTVSVDENPSDTASVAADLSADKPTVAEQETRVSTHGENKATPSTPRWIAENVALSPEEAALELEKEMRAAETAEAIEEKQPIVSAAPASTTSSPTPSYENEGASFAAAAGASGGAAVSAVATPSQEPEPPVAAETAAAWQNWQQIRDTVMNVQSTEAIGETIAQAAKAIAPVDEVAAAPQPESHPADTSSAEPEPAHGTQSSELDSALASIVDSVLAELKPKLMQEITRKLKK
jgi:CheY-like chemotaxis protein